MFVVHEPREFAFPSATDGSHVKQVCLGWRQGGCDIVWSDVLPRLLATHGESVCGGKTVVELGAGCGLGDASAQPKHASEERTIRIKRTLI